LLIAIIFFGWRPFLWRRVQVPSDPLFSLIDPFFLEVQLFFFFCGGIKYFLSSGAFCREGTCAPFLLSSLRVVTPFLVYLLWFWSPYGIPFPAATFPVLGFGFFVFFLLRLVVFSLFFLILTCALSLPPAFIFLQRVRRVQPFAPVLLSWYKVPSLTGSCLGLFPINFLLPPLRWLWYFFPVRAQLRRCLFFPNLPDFIRLFRLLSRYVIQAPGLTVIAS